MVETIYLVSGDNLGRARIVPYRILEETPTKYKARRRNFVKDHVDKLQGQKANWFGYCSSLVKAQEMAILASRISIEDVKTSKEWMKYQIPRDLGVKEVPKDANSLVDTNRLSSSVGHIWDVRDPLWSVSELLVNEHSEKCDKRIEYLTNKLYDLLVQYDMLDLMPDIKEI